MKMSHLALIVSASLLLGACATGKTKFQCPVPNGVACKSVKDMYEVTDAAGEQGLVDARNALHGSDGRSTKSRRGHARVETMDDGAHEVTLLDPGDPIPLRVAPRVLRVLITPWEDAGGDLHAGGYVFTEIESRRWSMAPPAQKTSRTAFPLQVEIAGMERKSNRATAVPGANTATPGKESAAAPGAKPTERSSGGGGS
jgi:conjugal transfer pilus assembly protein TraV